MRSGRSRSGHAVLRSAVQLDDVAVRESVIRAHLLGFEAGVAEYPCMAHRARKVVVD